MTWNGEWRSVFELLPHVCAALSGLITLWWALRRRLRLRYILAGITTLAVLAIVWIAVHFAKVNPALKSETVRPVSFPELLGCIHAALDNLTDDECRARRFLDLTSLGRLALDDQSARASLWACRRVLEEIPGIQSIDDQQLVYMVSCPPTPGNDAMTGWHAKLWGQLCQGYPYALRFTDPKYVSLQQRTDHPQHLGHQPVLRADWLLAVRWSELPGLRLKAMQSKDTENDLRTIRSKYDAKLSLAAAAAELWLPSDAQFTAVLKQIKERSSLPEAELDQLLGGEGIDRVIWDASQDAGGDSRWKPGADSLWQYLAEQLGMGEPLYAIPDAQGDAMDSR